MHASGSAASAAATCACTHADHATVLSDRSGFETTGGTHDGFGNPGISAPYLKGIRYGSDQQASGGAGHGYLRLRWPDLAALLPYRFGWRMKSNE